MEPDASLALQTRGSRRSVWAEVAAYATAVIAATLGAACVLRLWDASVARPWYGTGDALLQVGAVKGILDHGWYWSNPDLGVPHGAHLADFATFNGDFTQMVLLRGIGVLVDGPFAAANLFFLLTFPLVAFGALYALRSLGLSRWVGVAMAVLYALLPYHFERNVSHLYLTGYYTVPLLCLLTLDVLAGRPLVAHRPAPNRLVAVLTPRTIRTLVLCVLIGTTSAYFSAFGLILLVCASLLRGLSVRSWRALAVGLAAALVVAVCIAFVQLPGLVRRDDAGPLVAHRVASESELYGLKVDQLVFPIAEHRVGPLADLAREYESTTLLPSEPASNLGLVGVVGLAWLLVVALGSLAGAGRSRIGTDEERRVAVMTGVTLLIATVGGASAVFAWVVSPQVRSWNRMSVFVAFFALLATGFLLDRVRTAARTRGRAGEAALVLGFIAVLVVGTLDQTAPRFAPTYAESDGRQAVVDEFVADAERALPEGAAVLQLPYLPYPEAGRTNGMGDYEHMRGYLGSHDLRFSYGAVKGSADDWHGPAAGAPLDVVLDAAAAIGFDAVYVDRSAYDDGGDALGDSLDDALGGHLARSRDGRLLLWDLRGRRTELVDTIGAEGAARIREAATHPVRTFFEDGFTATVQATGSGTADATRNASITLQNDLGRSRSVELDTGLMALPNGASSVVLRFPDGSRRTIELHDEPTRLRHRFRIPAGKSHVAIEARGVPDGDLRDSASWHGAVGVPTAFEDRPLARFVEPSLVPVALCARRTAVPDPTAAPDASDAPAACTSGARPQVP